MTHDAPLSVVIAGGGTGGHLYPGIAVAHELRRRLPDARMSFAGTARGLESRVVPQEGFELDVIRSAGLKGKSLTARLRGASLLPISVLDAWRVLSSRRPDVVVGVGGYSSGPVVMLAALRGIPTMVLEQNAVPGLTNRLLARVVRAAAVTYQETTTFFGRRAIVTGNPVRQEFFSAGDAPPRVSRRVLILGGSQGAHAINVAMVAAAAGVVARTGGIELVHQTGTRDLEDVRRGYERAGVPARAHAFIDNVAAEMSSAALLVGRAGATTLAELAASRTPAILIPFPGATDDHQRKNARVLSDAGAAVLLDERDLTPDRLADAIATLLLDDKRRHEMSEAVGRFARPDAAARIADAIETLAGRRTAVPA